MVGSTAHAGCCQYLQLVCRHINISNSGVISGTIRDTGAFQPDVSGCADSAYAYCRGSIIADVAAAGGGTGTVIHGYSSGGGQDIDRVASTDADIARSGL